MILSGRITTTIFFGGKRYSISTLRTYYRIDGALIIPRVTAAAVLTVAIDQNERRHIALGFVTGQP